MHLSVLGIKPREKDDPDYADYWLELIHVDCHISWEVPLTKAEASKMKRYLPKSVQEQIPEVKDVWKK